MRGVGAIAHPFEVVGTGGVYIIDSGDMVGMGGHAVM